MERPPKGPEGNDLAQWLVESAQRARLDGNSTAVSATVVMARTRPGPTFTRSVLMSVAALCFLQYYYFHVMVEIGKLPTLIVFVHSPLT